jgi:hypothetical protein
MPEGISGANFLHQKNTNLQKSATVDRSVKIEERKSQEKIPNNPEDRIDLYLNRLEQIFKDKDLKRQERKINLFKEMVVYPNVLIDKNDIPDSYFNLQIKIAKERGEGGDLTEQGIETAKDLPLQTRKEKGEIIYQDQKKSLDQWFDYFSSSDASYDSWFKYHALKSVVKLGIYDKEKKKFNKRNKDTTTIFPDLNREALAFTYDVIKKHYLQGVKENNPDFKKIVDSGNFAKIYAYAIDKVTPASKENKEKVEGEWIKFKQGSNATPLYESLQGQGTGWCTAGEEMARSQLKGGDFYVYYSKDEDNKNTIPRIAIRMENNHVAEVRGIDPNQNMEKKMLDIAQEKYHGLPGGEKFDKKSNNMKFLTQIDKKINKEQELNKEELKLTSLETQKSQKSEPEDIEEAGLGSNDLKDKIHDLEMALKRTPDIFKIAINCVHAIVTVYILNIWKRS